MKKQRNYSQSKEQEKSPKKINNETGLSSLPDPEFRTEVIKMLKELSGTLGVPLEGTRRV